MQQRPKVAKSRGLPTEPTEGAKAGAKASRSHAEAVRYLNNAKELLKSAPIEGRFYGDKKPVREAFGTAYLAILEAINEKLISRGLTEKQLPKSVEEYRKALQKHVSVHNGKLIKEFNGLYDTLHIAGYYRGLIYNIEMVKDAMKAAKEFIDKVK